MKVHHARQGGQNNQNMNEWMYEWMDGNGEVHITSFYSSPPRPGRFEKGCVEWSTITLEFKIFRFMAFVGYV